MNKLTSNQIKLVRSFDNPFTKVVFVTGPAGTGKTHWMCKTALKMKQQNRIEKLVITRPTVSVDEELGYLPGTMNEKMEPWLLPMNEYLDFTKKIENVPLGYMRGRTFNDTFIIADEMQNSTKEQMKMLLTRIGKNSFMGITGDLNQSDIKDNGLSFFLEKYYKYFDYYNYLSINHIEFSKIDIKRSDVVNDILNIYEH